MTVGYAPAACGSFMIGPFQTSVNYELVGAGVSGTLAALQR